jgi:hypothetical protein
MSAPATLHIVLIDANLHLSNLSQFQLIFNLQGNSSTPPPRETMMLNELFREYLRFNGYNQTLSVFNAETSSEITQTSEIFTREFISADLGITLDSTKSHELPLVYALVHGYKSVCNMQQVLAPIVDRTTYEEASNLDTSALLASPGRMRTMDLAMPASPDDDMDLQPQVVDIAN